MKKPFILMAFAAVIALLSIFIAAPFINDNTARKTAANLADLPLPNDTELMETVYKAGKLVGNGNGMQYFGAILIKSKQSLEELQKYYLQFAQTDGECVVDHQTGAEITFIEHTQLTFKTDIADSNDYIVYSWGTNHTIFHELDLRGH